MFNVTDFFAERSISLAQTLLGLHRFIFSNSPNWRVEQPSRNRRQRANDKDMSTTFTMLPYCGVQIWKLRFWDIRQIHIFISMQSSDYSPLNIFSSSEFNLYGCQSCHLFDCTKISVFHLFIYLLFCSIYYSLFYLTAVI